MNKTKFLKEAQKLYKDQLEVKNKFVSEMNFIFSDTEVLRVWFDVNFVPNKKLGETGYMHRWCTVQTLPSQSDEKIENELGRFVSNETEDYPAIIKALRRELPICPNDLIDHVLFSETDEDANISPIEHLEFTYTIKQFCDLIGIK